MAFQEIERKFLVAGDFRKEASGASRIIQGFLSSAPGRTVRVRIRGEQGFLTVKGPAQGLTRFEWEKEIPAAEAEVTYVPVVDADPAVRVYDVAVRRRKN